MNYQSARIFLSVVEHGSFSAAASALYLSRPAVSSYLSRLEDELGVQLFVRQRGVQKVTLTPEGTNFIPVAKELLLGEKLLQEFKDSCNQKVLRIGAGPSVQSYIISPVAEKLRKMLPAIDLQQYTIPAHVNDVTRDVQPFDVSVRIHYTTKPVSNALFTSIPFFEDPWRILCPADTPLPDRVLSPEDLDPAFQILVVSSNSQLVSWQRQNFAEDTVLHHPVVLEPLRMPAYFRDARYWGIVNATTTYHLLEQYPGMLACRSIEPAPPPRTSHIIVSKSYSRQDVIRAFLQCCREYLEERPYLEGLLSDNM